MSVKGATKQRAEASETEEEKEGFEFGLGMTIRSTD